MGPGRGHVGAGILSELGLISGASERFGPVEGPDVSPPDANGGGEVMVRGSYGAAPSPCPSRGIAVPHVHGAPQIHAARTSSWPGLLPVDTGDKRRCPGSAVAGRRRRWSASLLGDEPTHAPLSFYLVRVPSITVGEWFTLRDWMWRASGRFLP